MVEARLATALTVFSETSLIIGQGLQHRLS